MRHAPLLLLVLAGCAPKPAGTAAGPAEPAAVPVTVADVAEVTVARTVSVVGTLDPYREVTLAPEVDGRVERVFHDLGGAVFPGERLLKLDDREYRLDVEHARAALAVELARLEADPRPGWAAVAGVAPVAAARRLPAPPVDVERVPAVANARAQLALARVELTRVERQRSGGGSEQDYDVARTKVEVAENAARIAEAEARAALANADRLRFMLDKAEKRLRDTELRAPHPGEWAAWAAAVGPGLSPHRYRVAQRLVWEGEMVRAMPEKNAFRLVMDHALTLRVAVPERYAPDVAAGQPVEVRVDAHKGQTFPGVVARVNPTVDPATRTFQVEVEVPNGGGGGRPRLKSGSFARAEVRTHTEAGVRTVPPAAVVSFAGVTKVFVVDGGRARAVAVEVGDRAGDRVEVRGPLPPGAKVVTSGQTQLVDGSLVRIR